MIPNALVMEFFLLFFYIFFIAAFNWLKDLNICSTSAQWTINIHALLHTHLCACLIPHQETKGASLQESSVSVRCKLARGGRPYCTFTDCVATVGASSFCIRFTRQLHQADTVSAPRSHLCMGVLRTHTHARTLLTTQWCTNSETEEQGRLTAHKLLFRSSSLRVFLFIYFFILERIRQMFEGGDGEEEEKALPSSASSWFLALLLAWYDMQTTMLLQRSVITVIEWRWQVASGLPVDGNPMLGWGMHTRTFSSPLSHSDTHTQSKLSSQDYLPLNCNLRPSVGVEMIDTQCSSSSPEVGEALKAVRPMKGKKKSNNERQMEVSPGMANLNGQRQEQAENNLPE